MCNPTQQQNFLKTAALLSCSSYVERVSLLHGCSAFTQNWVIVLAQSISSFHRKLSPLQQSPLTSSLLSPSPCRTLPNFYLYRFGYYFVVHVNGLLIWEFLCLASSFNLICKVHLQMKSQDFIIFFVVEPQSLVLINPVIICPFIREWKVKMINIILIICVQAFKKYLFNLKEQFQREKEGVGWKREKDLPSAG